MAIKKCVVIACVSFETAKIVEPAVSYGADEIHLFHYVRNPLLAKGNIYTEFYNEVVNQIRDKLPKVKIIEHADNPVYDFQAMFRELLKLVSEIKARDPLPPEGDDDYVGPDSDILVNASAGTSEFSAAAIITAMMSKNVNSFTVGTREFTVKTEDIKNLYYKAGKPVGLTEHTNAPRVIPNFDLVMPEENLVRALRTFYNRSQAGQSITASAVIQNLKEEGIWNYSASKDSVKTEPKQKEAMYYQRHYVNTWSANGWIEPINGYRKHRLTDNGLTIISTFYVD